MLTIEWRNATLMYAKRDRYYAVTSSTVNDTAASGVA